MRPNLTWQLSFTEPNRARPGPDAHDRVNALAVAESAIISLQLPSTGLISHPSHAALLSQLAVHALDESTPLSVNCTPTKDQYVRSGQASQADQLVELVLLSRRGAGSGSPGASGDGDRGDGDGGSGDCGDGGDGGDAMIAGSSEFVRRRRPGGEGGDAGQSCSTCVPRTHGPTPLRKTHGRVVGSPKGVRSVSS